MRSTFDRVIRLALGAAALAFISNADALDLDGDQLSDVWELIYNAQSLTAGADTDSDGYDNLRESAGGTNPFDPGSRPTLALERGLNSGSVGLFWGSARGKAYDLESSEDFSSGLWQNLGRFDGTGALMNATALTTDFTRLFFRIAISDKDSDLASNGAPAPDGVSDWEELVLGFNPYSARTDRNDQTDLQRITTGLTAPSTITVAALDSEMSERWPDRGVFAIRRGGGGLAPLTVNIQLGGTASAGLDYSVLSGSTTTVSIPPGGREVWIELAPIADALDAEPTETVTVAVVAGSGYTLGAGTTATLNLVNETAHSLPSAKAAARFLIQAAFGPDQDSSGDADPIPENVEEVMAIGFEAWIDDQFTRPVGYIQPWVDWAVVNAETLQLYGNWKEFSWWSRAMGAPKLRPDDTETVAPDPLRQRVAFALSEILVASDRPEALAVEQRGMANFYDLFEQHAFGNYRDLLQAVALHPVMGYYLSHIGNQKANPAANTFPDENFAREVMQLFSIGLWELNQDGTRQLNAEGQPIPTYDNDDITELARVFTGLSFGNNTNFSLYPRDFTVPMKGWDAYHDLGAKTLLGGFQLPARTASPGNTGTATMADVSAAIDNLFNHQNVGPFLAYRLIQRFVTSNPSSAYVGRVAAAFANNGAGVRGDMKAVIKAILLDPEARAPEKMSEPTWGKLREPFLRCVNFARAFNAASTSGHYPLDRFSLAHLQDPMNSPSVFNFFLPNHSPSGPLADAGLAAPEFQLINAASAVSGANYFWSHILNDLHHWGNANPAYQVRPNIDLELAMVTSGDINANVPLGELDPDALLRRLDLVLTGGTLAPEQFQIIREGMLRIPASTWRWHRERLRLAIYLIVTSAEFNVLR